MMTRLKDYCTTFLTQLSGNNTLFRFSCVYLWVLYVFVFWVVSAAAVALLEGPPPQTSRVACYVSAALWNLICLFVYFLSYTQRQQSSNIQLQTYTIKAQKLKTRTEYYAKVKNVIDLLRVNCCAECSGVTLLGWIRCSMLGGPCLGLADHTAGLSLCTNMWQVSKKARCT